MKKYFFGVLAITLAIGLNSFVISKKQFSGTWYKYNFPGIQTPALRESPTSYVKVSSEPTNCTDDVNECAVEMPFDNGNTPDFSAVSFDPNGFPIRDGVTVIENAKKP